MVKIHKKVSKIHCEGVKWLFEIALFNSNQSYQSRHRQGTKWVTIFTFTVLSRFFLVLFLDLEIDY